MVWVRVGVRVGVGVRVRVRVGVRVRVRVMVRVRVRVRILNWFYIGSLFVLYLIAIYLFVEHDWRRYSTYIRRI